MVWFVRVAIEVIQLASKLTTVSILTSYFPSSYRFFPTKQKTIKNMNIWIIWIILFQMHFNITTCLFARKVWKVSLAFFKREKMMQQILCRLRRKYFDFDYWITVKNFSNKTYIFILYKTKYIYHFKSCDSFFQSFNNKRVRKIYRLVRKSTYRSRIERLVRDRLSRALPREIMHSFLETLCFCIYK